MKREVHHIGALKGQRQRVELNVTGAERARAAEAAGIDIVAFTRFRDDVREARFPDRAKTLSCPQAELEAFQAWLVEPR